MEDDNFKDLQVIYRKLSELRREEWDLFMFYVGEFVVKIWHDLIRDMRIQNVSASEDLVTNHDKVHVLIYQKAYNKIIDRSYIILEQDPRFSAYKEKNMPIMVLCELIKYLYRLSNLTAFS